MPKISELSEFTAPEAGAIIPATKSDSTASMKLSAFQIGDLASNWGLSAAWQNAYTTVNATSAAWGSGEGGWEVGGTNVSLVTNTNKVGIGTDSPNSLLHLYHATVPALRLEHAESTTGVVLGVTTGGNGELWNYDNAYLRFGTNNVERLRITTGGNVGIGLIDPVYPLHIYADDYAYAHFTSSEDTNGLSVGVNDDLNVALVRYRENRPLTFWTNDYERARIDSNGNVGIGSTVPGQKLTVAGAISANTVIYDSTGNSNQWVSTHSTVNTISAKWVANEDDVTNLANASGDWASTHTTVNTNSSRWGELEGDLTNVANTSANWDSAYAQVGDSTTDLNIDSGVLFVDKSTNKVGIGTTEPIHALTVAGTISARDDLYIGGTAFLSAGSTTGEMYFGNDKYDTHVFTGNVGIGTNNPDGDLSINHSLSSEVVVTFLADESNVEVKSNSKIKALGSSTGTGGTLQFFTKPDGADYTVAPQILIEPTGSIGMSKSTVTSGYVLDVGGSIYSDGIIYAGGTTSPSNLYSLVLRRSGYNLDNVDIYDHTGRGIVLGGDSTESTLSIITGGRVGVNTVSAAEPLHVAGNIRVADGYSYNFGPGLGYSGDSSVAGGKLFMQTGSGTRVTITTGGNVGIGTTAPQEQLHIASSDSGDSTVQFTNSTTSHAASKGFHVGVNADELAILWQYESGDMVFGVGNDQKMCIQTGGNVGIGTALPTSILTVGDGTTSPAVHIDKVAGGTSSLHFRAAGAASAYVSTNTNNGVEVGTNNASRIHVLSSGNVGIGTSSPNYVLDVDSSGAVASIAGREGFVINTYSTAANYYAYRGIGFHGNAVELVGIRSDGVLQVGTQNSGGLSAIDIRCNNLGSLMYIESGGDIGMGVIAPTGNLHVHESTTDVSADIKLTTAGTGKASTDGVAITVGGTDNVLTIANKENADVIFEANAAEVVRFKADGKVGIGTNSPSTQLDVVGSVQLSNNSKIQWGDVGTHIQGSNSSDNIIVTTNTAERMRIESDGKVGIGTTTPANMLDVAGNIRAKNSVSDTSIIIDAINDSYLEFLQAGTQRWGLINDYINGQTFTVWDYGASTTRMAITTAGTVGINDSAPESTLDVKYDGSSGAAFNVGATNNNSLLTIAQSGTDNALVQLYAGGVVATKFSSIGDSYLTGGNFGIGTNSPADKLHVHNGSVRITNDGNNPHILLGDEIVGGNYSAIRHDSSSDDLWLQTNESTRIAVKEDGKVGIGTTTPNEDLTVVGNVSASGTVFGANVIEIGMILPYAGSAAPAGYFLCNGAEKSRTDASTKPLFDLIGTTYGTGNDVDTYNLPDLIGRVPIGAGSGAGLTARTLGAEGGTDDLTAGATDAAGAFTVINYIIKY